MNESQGPNNNPLTTAEMMAAYRAEQEQPHDEAQLGWLYLGFVAACFIALLALAWFTLDDDSTVGGLGVEPLEQPAAQLDPAPTVAVAPEATTGDADTSTDTTAEEVAEISTEDVQAEVSGLLEGTTILFDANEATISSGAAVITEVAAAVVDTDLNLTVEGYTDSVGDEDDNLELSQERADTVRDALVAEGIDAARITTQGFGETEAVQDDPTDQERADDRRIEIVIAEA